VRGWGRYWREVEAVLLPRLEQGLRGAVGAASVDVVGGERIVRGQTSGRLRRGGGLHGEGGGGAGGCAGMEAGMAAVAGSDGGDGRNRTVGIQAGARLCLVYTIVLRISRDLDPFVSPY
jgi:hypothetical protein